ncbi:MAG: penicillin-binding protein 2 [Limnobacter sp.]|nr:penicillin-binding protein 2 [Limnobacter sp.]
MVKRVSFGSSNVLEKKGLPVWRSRLVLFGLMLAFGGLVTRAAYLQIISDDFLKQQGAKRMERTLPLKANRGTLVDRNSKMLAQSVPAQTVWYDSRVIVKATDDQLRQVARLLKQKEEPLIQKVRKDKRHYAYLDRQVDSVLAQKIKDLKVPGVNFTTESKRSYPQGETLAHLVGFTDVEDKGQEGVELAFNDKLTGEDGERSVIRDRLGNVIDEVRELRPPIDGENLTLSVDADIQYIVLSELRKIVQTHNAKAAGAVVLDAKTGELLAMANIPTYDPNNRNALYGPKLRNRVFTDMFEPGSTMKPFAVALALDKGNVTPSTRIDTLGGRMRIGSAVISDAHAHGVMTVEEIIQKSSNIGTTRMALDIPSKEMWDFFHLVGFGKAPAVKFPGSVAGVVRPWNKWKPIEQATMSYGHGITVSLIQMAQAYTIFANNGYWMPVRITKLGEGEKPEGHQAIKPKTAAQMLKMLEMAAGPGGTAPKSQVQGYRVAGKTGTAHKQEGGRYVNKYLSSFVGLAPVSNPRVIVAVMVDEPGNGVYYGGAVAAPVFSTITKSVLNKMSVEPDALLSPIDSRSLVSAPHSATVGAKL